MATSYDPPTRRKSMAVHLEHSNPGGDNLLTRSTANMYKTKQSGDVSEYSPTIDLQIPDNREVADATAVQKRRKS